MTFSLGDPNLDLLMKEEPLHDDLEQYVRRTSVMGEMVHSPLVISPLYSRQRCAHINGLYEQKRAQIAEAAAERNWHRIVMLHERPYRFTALQECLMRGLEEGSSDFWEVVGQVWVDSENIHEHFSAWRSLWKGGDSGGSTEFRYRAMSEEDREGFSKLRSRIRIYRGYSWNRGVKLGMSWTTSRQKAAWFAQRFDERGSGHVITAYVDKASIYAFFARRGEQEVVVDPDVIGNKWEHVDL